MKHECGPIAEESAEQARHRAEFEEWMRNNYPGLIKQSGVHPNSGYYDYSPVNCCWEIWLHLSEKRS